MPTYEYRCRVCGYQFEKFQQMTDDAEKLCPDCGAEVQRLIGSGAGFIMKGGGASTAPTTTRCGKTQTCCGRQEPCNTPSCEA
jgi:putative FmdB family regulatory protein